MALIDAEFWRVRRKLKGAAGASQVMSSAPVPLCEKRVAYLRLRPTSCNPSSKRQCEARARWSSLSHAWQKELTAENREDWQWMVDEDEFRWYDEEQQSRHICGYEWFMAVNARVLAAGLPLVKDTAMLWWGVSLSTLAVTFLSETTIRVAFEPDEDPYCALAVYCRGPMSPGCHAVVPEIEWARYSVPSRWRLVGFSALAAASPVDFELPAAVPSGRKLAVMACLMDYSGLMADEWLVDEVIAA